MYAKFSAKLATIRESFQDRFHGGLSMRKSLLLSIVLHLIAGGAIAAYWAGSQVAAHLASNDKIVFDLETISPKENIDKLTGPQAEEYGVTNADAKDVSGKASTFLKGNMNRDAVVMASLASLSKLTESFGFITHAVAADSLGGFSPADGNIPGSEYDSFGRKKGEGRGAGDGSGIRVSGGGFCPIPGGY